MKKRFVTMALTTILAATAAFTCHAVYAATSTVPVSTESFSTNAKSPFTNTKYTHNETIAKDKNIYLGVDVSKYQTDIDWEKAKAAGVQYAFIRLGYRGASTGKITLDTYFTKNMEGAISAGIPVGVYFYTEAITEAEAKEEAKYCIEQLKPYKVSLPVAFDFEYSNANGRLVKAKLSKAKSTKQCEAFCNTIKAAGYTPMVYASTSVLNSNIDGAALSKKYKIWVAQYNTSCKFTAGSYDYWQYSSSGKVDGIKGSVDCNFWYTSSYINDLVKEGTKMSKVTVKSIPNQTYTGKTIKPALTVTYKGKTLKKNTDYTVSYSNNKKIGKATVTLTGKGNYYNKKTISFKIVPTKITSFRKKSGTKSITLAWSKNSTATGYILYRKSSYNSKSYTKLTALSSATLRYVNTKLKDDKEYFYAIRAYTKVGSTKYYSDYTYLTAATLPGGNTATIKNNASLYKLPDLSGTALVKISKNSQITYLGRTYTSGTNYVYHIKYAVGGKTYNGYVKNTVKFSF